MLERMKMSLSEAISDKLHLSSSTIGSLRGGRGKFLLLISDGEMIYRARFMTREYRHILYVIIMNFYQHERRSLCGDEAHM